MEKKRKIRITLALALVFFFVLATLSKGDKPPWAGKLPSEPIWEITQDSTDISVQWVDHVPNPRFAIYDPGTPEDETDDVVLDKETGLVWERYKTYQDIEQMHWHDACEYCYNRYLGGRKGWRMPTIEELTSLVDLNNSSNLPSGHPFIHVGNIYWSSTTIADRYPPSVYDLGLHDGVSSQREKDTALAYVWCVRGGQGYDAY